MGKKSGSLKRKEKRGRDLERDARKCLRLDSFFPSKPTSKCGSASHSQISALNHEGANDPETPSQPENVSDCLPGSNDEDVLKRTPTQVNSRIDLDDANDPETPSQPENVSDCLPGSNDEDVLKRTPTQVNSRIDHEGTNDPETTQPENVSDCLPGSNDEDVLKRTPTQVNSRIDLDDTNDPETTQPENVSDCLPGSNDEEMKKRKKTRTTQVNSRIDHDERNDPPSTGITTSLTFYNDGDIEARKDDTNLKNKFRWDWLELSDKIEIEGRMWELKYSCFKKPKLQGKVFCALCNCLINYDTSGKKSMQFHVKSSIHTRNWIHDVKSMKIAPAKDGLHLISSENRPSQMTSTSDRIAKAQSIVLAFIAEHSLSLSVAPSLLELAKELSKDTKVLSLTSMDRTTASYKMTYGLRQTIQEDIVKYLQENPFSLNIDECTSKTNQKVLGVLASYFCSHENKVVIEHLDAIHLISVNAESLLNSLDASFKNLKIPWKNLVSVLMDSCAVMRGSKTGLEVRIRAEKQEGLLDIDGDVCHTIHNASKSFTAPFGGEAEHLFDDLFFDQRWSPEILECFSLICEEMGIAATKPERFVRHRWLSCYNLSLSTIRQFDAFFLLYCGFLSLQDRRLYQDKVHEKIRLHGVEKRVVQDVWNRLHPKFKSMTQEGRQRKERIADRLIRRETEMQLILHFYAAVLPVLKEYVILFQSQRPLIHRLYEKQEKLLRELFSFFIREDALKKTTRQLIGMSLFDDDITLSYKNLFVGNAAKILDEMPPNDILVKRFYSNVKEAYRQCGTYLQKKLPLDNELLKSAAALDPALQHNIRLPLLKKLKSYAGHFLSVEEFNQYDMECHKYVVDMSLPKFEEDKDDPDRIDSWWAQVKSLKRYPSLCKMALTLCTIFHGPLVESSFNTMGDILGKKMSRKSVLTYSSYQAIKYHLKSRNMNAVKYFSDCKYKKLYVNMKSSSSRYRASLRERAFSNSAVISKVRHRLEFEKQMRENRQRHLLRKKRNATLTLLANNAKKRRKSVY